MKTNSTLLEKYHLNLCPVCERPIISRKQTLAERIEWQKQFPDKGSVSVFEQETYVVIVPCLCNPQPDYALGITISAKRAKELTKQIRSENYI